MSIPVLDGVLKGPERLQGHLAEPYETTPYVLPIASASTLGGVKIPSDGNITIDQAGNIRAQSSVSATIGYMEVGS